jgi:hypothetical protein
LLHLALVAPEPREAGGGAQFQRFRLLGLRNVDCVLKGSSALVELGSYSRRPASACSQLLPDPQHKPTRPGAMMRLEPQFIISLPFGQPQQSLRERPGGGYSTRHHS